MKMMEQYKKMDKNKLLLSPSAGKQQTRVSYGQIQNNDFDDSDYNKATTNSQKTQQSLRHSANESISSL